MLFERVKLLKAAWFKEFVQFVFVKTIYHIEAVIFQKKSLYHPPKKLTINLENFINYTVKIIYASTNGSIFQKLNLTHE